MAEGGAVECERSGKNVLEGGYAICPGCQHVVHIRLVGGLWTFLPHDEKGFPIQQSGRSDG